MMVENMQALKTGHGGACHGGATKSSQAKGNQVDETMANGGKGLVLFEIEKAKKAGMNMLLPSTHIEGVSEFHSPVLDYVELSSEPADGDVYYHSESKKLVPSKQGLMKLAVCAGIMWDMSQTKRTDNRRSRDYVSYSAVGAVRKADGTMVPFPAEYDMDFEVIEEKLRDQYEKKGKSAKKSGDELQGYIDYCVKRDILYKREHKLKICEAGAMNRVIRSLLGLKSGYTKQELKKPFVVARIVFRPDYSDPQIRNLMIQKSIESLTSVYGGGEQTMPIPPPAPSAPSAPSEENPEDNSDDELTNEKADFLASDKDGQIDTLKKLAKRKGYDLKQLKRPLMQFKGNYLEAFFDKLTSMEDDNDIPF